MKQWAPAPPGHAKVKDRMLCFCAHFQLSMGSALSLPKVLRTLYSSQYVPSHRNSYCKKDEPMRFTEGICITVS
jgi:hypothetical protein